MRRRCDAARVWDACSEIATAFVALFADGMHPAMGVGNIVGSATFQILVVGLLAARRDLGRIG